MEWFQYIFHVIFIDIGNLGIYLNIGWKDIRSIWCYVILQSYLVYQVIYGIGAGYTKLLIQVLSNQ